MFDRFTDHARKAMALSRKESSRLRHEFIGTEHILLGLIQIDPLAELLGKLGIDAGDVRRKVESAVVPGSKEVTLGQLPFTPRAKKVLELSVEEAHELGHDFIDIDHVLVGLLREKEGVAGQVLCAMGLDTEKVRTVAWEGNRTSPRESRGGLAAGKRPWWKFW